MTRFQRLLILLGGMILLITLSSSATQWVAYQLNYHAALGPQWQGLYQPFAWISWQNEPWAINVKPAFFYPDIGLGIIATAFMAAAIVKNLRTPGSRQPKPHPDVHGSAAWATVEDIARTGLLMKDDGIYVGAWQDPKSGTIHYLRDNTGKHIAGIAPTRSGKGLGWVLPNLLSWPHSAFIYDPKGELWQLTAGWRKSIGQNILRWEPGDPDFSCGFNFLNEVRLSTSHEVADAQNIATMLIDPDGSGFDNHWDRAAYGFLTGYILHCLYVARESGSKTSLPIIAALLSSPKVTPAQLCQSMATSRYGAAIVAAGVDQMARDERERGAVLSTVKTYLSLFLDPVIAKNTTQSSFRIVDLMDHDNPTSLYVMVPGADSVRLRPLVRLLITMVLNHLVSVPVAFDAHQQPMQTHRHRMLLMMEEFPTLRRLRMFETAMAVMAGSGLTAFLVMQDREQLLGAYGQHQTIMANIHIIAAYAPNEGKTADWLSHELGNQTVNLEQFSASGKRGAWRLTHLSQSYSPISRPLLTSDEIKRLRGPTMIGSRVTEAGQMIILPTGERPILGRQILYFEDPIIAPRSRLLPPACGDDLELKRLFKLVKQA